MVNREFLEKWKKENPGTFRGLQLAIAGPEGTLNPDGTVAYRRQFGGGNFKRDDRHPDTVYKNRSAAAGGYQFMPATWNAAAKTLGLSKFDPESQDLAMLYLAQKRLAPVGGLTALAQKGLTPELTDKLAWEWAGLPTKSGASAYPNQSVSPYSKVLELFNKGKNETGKTSPTLSTTITANPQTTTTTNSLASLPPIKLSVNFGNVEQTKPKKTDPLKFLMNSMFGVKTDSDSDSDSDSNENSLVNSLIAKLLQQATQENQELTMTPNLYDTDTLSIG